MTKRRNWKRVRTENLRSGGQVRTETYEADKEKGKRKRRRNWRMSGTRRRAGREE